MVVILAPLLLLKMGTGECGGIANSENYSNTAGDQHGGQDVDSSVGDGDLGTTTHKDKMYGAEINNMETSEDRVYGCQAADQKFCSIIGGRELLDHEYVDEPIQASLQPKNKKTEEDVQTNDMIYNPPYQVSANYTENQSLIRDGAGLPEQLGSCRKTTGQITIEEMNGWSSALEAMPCSEGALSEHTNLGKASFKSSTSEVSNLLGKDNDAHVQEHSEELKKHTYSSPSASDSECNPNITVYSPIYPKLPLLENEFAVDTYLWYDDQANTIDNNFSVQFTTWKESQSNGYSNVLEPFNGVVVTEVLPELHVSAECTDTRTSLSDRGSQSNDGNGAHSSEIHQSEGMQSLLAEPYDATTSDNHSTSTGVKNNERKNIVANTKVKNMVKKKTYSNQKIILVLFVILVLCVCIVAFIVVKLFLHTLRMK
ncbi:hypothetical protein VCUG_01203 [Vavraia culicis subsp. floridensis]|uniref:Uncharacterized protein n=1 Tax=Vavraia culicis (isolate floridensis) TaxID=948595 RepID=L2GUL5_VAVCU|nr:uncharacterized protein VCUG_01203 [Vavraia culicis subsp. floridensis]ELA47319.1 hypothetical protein VCUG_01203 [Vavraia culicis subsp. floridensis]